MQLTPTPLLENWTSSSSSASTRLPHVRAGNLSEQDKLDALPVGGRLFMDVVRMIAYRAETPHDGAGDRRPGQETERPQVAARVADLRRQHHPRACARHPADTVLGLGSDACDRMLAPLIEELNATRTIYPGTQLTLVYEMAADSPLDVSSDSG